MILSMKLTKEEQERFWRLWELGQSDGKYAFMLREMRKLEPKYEKILQSLPAEQRDIVCDYV